MTVNANKHMLFPIQVYHPESRYSIRHAFLLATQVYFFYSRFTQAQFLKAVPDYFLDFVFIHVCFKIHANEKDIRTHIVVTSLEADKAAYSTGA